MPPLGSSPDASLAEASSRSLQVQRTPAEQDRRRKDRLAKRQKKLEAKQRDRDQSISGQRKGGQSTPAAHRQGSEGTSKKSSAPARTVEPQDEDRKLHRKRARSQSRIRDRSPSPYRAVARARSKSRGRGYVSEEMSYSRAESDESSSDDSDGSRGETRLVQGPNKKTKLENNLERTALLTFRLRPSSSQFERVLDGVPSLATAQEHVRTKFHLGKSSVFRLSSESPLGGSVVLEDEEDFRAFKLRVLRSKAESTVITVDVIPPELHPPSARMSASTSPSPAPGHMLPPYLKHLAVQAPPRAPPMASTPVHTPVQAPAAKPRPSDTRPTDRAAMSQPLQALPPPVLPVQRPAPRPLPAAESAPYVPPSLRAKYNAASASTSSGSPNIAPALSPNLGTLSAPTAPVQLDPKPTASATLAMTKPTDVSKAEAKKLQKGPSASQKWVEARILAKTPCGICKASPFHACYNCPELIRGGLPYAEGRLEALKQMKRKRAWHSSAIKDLEAVIANTKAIPSPNNAASGSGEADKTSTASDEATAPVQAAAPATMAADAGQGSLLPVPAAAAAPSAPAPAAASSPSSPVLAPTGLEANPSATAGGHEARVVEQATAQPVQQAHDEEQDELAATQEMEQRQSQLPAPAGAHVTPTAPATEEAAQTATTSATQTSDAVPNADAPDKGDAMPIDTDARSPSQSQQLTERQAQRQLKQRETKWNKIRKDCAAAQDKVREYMARETRGENMPGPARYHFARHQTTLKKKTAELEELESELSDFATRMNLPRPPRAPELDVKIPESEAEVRRSPRVAGVQKSPVSAPSGDAASSAAQRGEGEASGIQTRSQESNVPPAIPAKKRPGRPKRLAVSSDTQAEDPPANTESRKSLSDIAQTIDTSATQTATPAVGSAKARVGLRTPLSDDSEDDVETSPILRSVASEQATERIDEQPLPPPMMQATASPRITRRTSQTMQPTVAENENDADDELESAAEGPRPTPRSPAKRGGQAGSPTSKGTLHSASANGDASSKRSEVPSQSSTAPPSSALTLPDPSQAPSRRITRQAAPRLASSSSSGSETSDDSDDSDEEMQGPEVAAEDDNEAESGGEEEEASEEDDAGGAGPDGSGEEEEEDEIEATQVSKGAVNVSGSKQQNRSVSPASSHTRSRSDSAASSIDSAGSKGQVEANEEEEDVASSSSTAMLSDREEEADPISTFSKQPASPTPAPKEAVQAPRSSGIFSSFNFFQSNRNSQDVNGTKAAMTQPNGVSGRSVNGANQNASQPGRRPKLSMPRLSELDASVLLRRRQQPNDSAASSQASTPIVATRGQNLAAPIAATDDDDEGPDEADDNDSGSESSSSSSSESSSDSDDGKNKKKASPAQKKGKAGAAKNTMPASKRASVAVDAAPAGLHRQ